MFNHAGAVFLAHAGWLRSWLRKQLGCSHRAADLAPDTFGRAPGRRNAPALDEPRARLTTITRGLLVDRRSNAPGWPRLRGQPATLARMAGGAALHDTQANGANTDGLPADHDLAAERQ